MQALITSGRREFTAEGFSGASLDRIAEQAGLTKGAIYHHFGSKIGLFEAVFRDAEHEIVRRIESRAESASSLAEGIRSGCEAFLDVAVDDELRRITLEDGPRVLGWSAWRAIDAEFGLGSLKEGIAACERNGLISGYDPDVLAHMISGALNEAVFLIAEAEDRGRVREEVSHALGALLAFFEDAPERE